jgi:3D (Asp-Asp-Asp) domain-containing protein
MKKILMPFTNLFVYFGFLAGIVHLVHGGDIQISKFINCGDSAQNVEKLTQNYVTKLTQPISHTVEQKKNREETQKAVKKSYVKLNNALERFVESTTEHFKNFSLSKLDILVYKALKESPDTHNAIVTTRFLKEGQECDESFSYFYYVQPFVTAHRLLEEKKCVENPSKLKAILLAWKKRKPHKSIKDIVKGLNVVATAYTNDLKSIGSRYFDGKTATMTRVRWGVVAVDPRVIPLGSKIYIENMGWFSAEDTGGKVKGKKIDIFYPTRKQALKFGKRRLKVFVLTTKVMKKYNYKIKI